MGEQERVEQARHHGRVALITGGTKGIGRGIAEHLAGEGAAVALCARNADEVETTRVEFTDRGIRVFAVVADVRSVDDVNRFVKDAAAQLGGIDYVINNAGGAAPGQFEDVTDEAWYGDFDVKVMSMIRVSRAALPYLRRSARPRIVNIGSVYGRSPDPRFFATSTLRSACMSFTKTLALQLAPDGILVNIVNVGFITTPQWENIRSRISPYSPLPEFESAMVGDEVPLGRFGAVDEVTPIVSLLCSQAGSYITGASIDVSGGMGRYV